MLDLQPIKYRLEMASPDKGRRVGYPPDADLQNNAYDDLKALVAEVERLRDGIKEYCHVTENALEIWKYVDSYATLKALVDQERR